MRVAGSLLSGRPCRCIGLLLFRPTDLIGTIIHPCGIITALTCSEPTREVPRDGDWRQTEAAYKAHFNGYRRLENPHQNCVDYLSLSLDTLRNGLSCLRLALRPFLCLLDYSPAANICRRHRAVTGLIQLIDRDRLPSGRPMPSVCTVLSRASMASYMRSLPQTSAMIEPIARKTFVAFSSKALGPR
jgi:hypothetical protein